MLTRNGMLASIQTSSKNYKKTDGTTAAFQGQTIRAAAKVGIGSGNTPATIDDYTLETPITTLTASQVSVIAVNVIEDGFEFMIVTTYTNNTSEDVTVREVGWLADAGVLLSREIIDPVTIGPNESKTFTIKVG